VRPRGGGGDARRRLSQRLRSCRVAVHERQRGDEREGDAYRGAALHGPVCRASSPASLFFFVDKIWRETEATVPPRHF
jgi:hypothetical protein